MADRLTHCLRCESRVDSSQLQRIGRHLVCWVCADMARRYAMGLLRDENLSRSARYQIAQLAKHVRL